MDKTILITGGTGKVGAVLVNYYATEGYDVIFTSRDKQKIIDIEKKYPNVYGIKVDFSKRDCVSVILKELQVHDLQVNYLINNARNVDALKIENDSSILLENWILEYQIDVIIPYQLSMALAKKMPLKKIINISSMYGVNAYNPALYEWEHKFPLQYACAKAALIHLTKCLAVQFADRNIAVNCISFGGIEGRVDAAFEKRYAMLCPQKRMMKESELVGGIDFLISEESSYITGQNINIDGGWSIW